MNQTERKAHKQAHELDELLNALQAGETTASPADTAEAALAHQLVELSAHTELSSTFTTTLNTRLQHAYLLTPIGTPHVTVWQRFTAAVRTFEMNHKHVFVTSIVSIAIFIGVAIATPLVMPEYDLTVVLPTLPAAPSHFFEPSAQATAAVMVLPNAPTAPAPNIMPSITTPVAPNVLQRTNILVMGVDRRPNENGAARTDTLMVVSIVPVSKTVSILSIPRDLWVTIPGYADDRINTVYLVGETQKYPGRGPALAKAAIQTNLGVPIHYYVLVDFVGFRRMIDELGGIDVDVPQDIHDELFPDDDEGYRTLHIAQGRQHLSGELALDYVRTRHQDSDFGRMRRQQQVLLAIKDRALQMNTLAKLPTLWSFQSDSVQTDLPLEKVVELATLAKDLKAQNFRTVTIDATLTTPKLITATGAMVLLPDRAKIRETIAPWFQ